MPAEIARTERLVLRRWRASDRQPFAAMNADPRVMEFFPAMLSTEESDRLVDRIEAHFEESGFGPCAVELIEDGSFLGYVGLAIPRFTAHFTPCVEIGWRIAPSYWNRGFATEAAREIIRQAFEVHRIEELVSFTSSGNFRSRRVMEKLGMTHDSAEDFDHPGIAAGHPLQRHVLYRLRRGAGSTVRQ